ncbi:hypothetical protein O6H91_02G087700 [Diphasiastrum complanatum]|uniref:Uncharacterized protein n=2 Tax=Diphasiastrum complanatum TaxID=34168 RepID=A0ACC2EHY2_DIPCM|nr:hypothetical protein O6H91_02G087700 [Diphasiastrum complanatum]KAJ7566097.1 hypothetical protein O6H91_02G087700 [Diphasiastrum complanatum]
MDPRLVNFLNKDEDSGLVAFEGADADARRAVLNRGVANTGISAAYGLATAGISNLRPMPQVLHMEPGSASAGVGKVVAGSSIVGNQAQSLEWQQLASQQRESLLQTHQQMMQEQQGADAGASNSAGKRPTGPNQGGISFATIMPILMRELPPENRQQLSALFQKWKKGEMSKEDLLRCLKLIVGDQMLSQAVRVIYHEQRLTAQQQAFRAAMPSYEQMIQKQCQQEQEHQLQQQKNQIELQKVQQQTQVNLQEHQHQQQKNQIELQKAQQQTQAKPPQDKQLLLYSQEVDEEAETDSSNDSDLQSNQLMTITQQQTPQMDLKQQLHLQQASSNFSDALNKANMSLSKMKPGEQVLERGPIHLNPIPASLQQVKHEVDRSLASMQLTFQQQQRQQQLSAHEAQGTSAGFHSQNSVVGKPSIQSQPQALLQAQQPAEGQGKLFLQQSQLLQPRVLDAESVQAVEKPLSKYAKQKIRREQKKREDEERLRKIQESDRLKKMLNASNPQATEQQLQHQQSQLQTAQQEGRVNVSISDRSNTSVLPSPATLCVKQESYEQQTSQIQTMQSFHSNSREKDPSEKNLSEKADGRSQLELERSPTNISGTEAANLATAPSNMSVQTIAISGGPTVSSDAPPSEPSSGQPRPPASMPGSLIQQIMAFQAKATPKKAVVVQKKPADTAPMGQPPSKKMKVGGGDPEQSIDQLNDVTVVSGVNLREEEEQLLVGPKEESRTTEAIRKFALEEENRSFLEKASLHAKVSSIATKHGIKNINDDVERCLSMSVEERLWSMVHRLVKISKQRSDMEQEKHTIVKTSDVRMQVMLIRRRAKEELDKKQAEEAERLRKLNEEKQALADVGKESIMKTQKEQQQEEDKLRTDAANLVARAAVGVDDMLMKWQMMAEQGRQKRQGDSGGVDSTAGTKPQDRSVAIESKGMPLGLGKTESNTQGILPALSTGKPSGPASDASKTDSTGSRLEKVPRKITVKDVIAFLELEPQMAKSALLYKLYERDRKAMSDEEAVDS